MGSGLNSSGLAASCCLRPCLSLPLLPALWEFPGGLSQPDPHFVGGREAEARGEAGTQGHRTDGQGRSGKVPGLSSMDRKAEARSWRGSPWSSVWKLASPGLLHPSWLELCLYFHRWPREGGRGAQFWMVGVPWAHAHQGRSSGTGLYVMCVW